MKLASSLLLTSLSVCASPAHAATYVVSNLSDGDPGSLRAAVNAANSTPGAPHMINFASTVQGRMRPTSQITIRNDMVINGPGAVQLLIDGNNMTRLFKIDLPNNNQSVTLTGMTISYGTAVGTDPGYGGAIYKTRGNLRIVGSLLTDNKAGSRGGAIYSDGGAVTLEDVIMANNEVPASGTQGSGGALYMRAGAFTSSSSRIFYNKAEFGGGIALASPGNHATITNTVFQGNTASGVGGGLYTISLQSFRMSNSAFIENVAELSEAAGLYYNGSTPAGALEGIIENTTFHANSARASTAASSALSITTGALTVRNSTFANNTVSPDTASARQSSGAIWIDGTNTRVKLVSVLLDRNTSGNGGQFSDLARVASTQMPSTLDVASSLLRSDYQSSVITSQSAPNQFATDALLGSLDTSISLSPAVPISRLSPAIDRGVNPGNLTTDQRGTGFARAWSDPNHRNDAFAKPDIGAYEFRGDAIFVGDFEQR